MNRQHAEPIVSEIIRLWEVATSLPAIAAGLHLPERLVMHVLQHGALPEEQPSWHQPKRDWVSER